MGSTCSKCNEHTSNIMLLKFEIEKYKYQDCEVIIGNLLINLINENVKKTNTLGITQRLAVQNKIVSKYNEIYI